jgi:hypothetical protein
LAVEIPAFVAAPRSESDPLKAERSAARAADRAIMRGLVEEKRAKHRPAKERKKPVQLDPSRPQGVTVTVADLTVHFHGSRSFNRFVRSRRRAEFLLDEADLRSRFPKR